jgi:hypothetical protein
VSQPIDIVQRSLPEPELLVLDAVEQIERSNEILFSRFEVEEGNSPMPRLRRTHFPKEVGASGTFSVYCSTEQAVYTLTVNAK